jgi:Cu(I)/Ag(I) efflux system membrane fusion protein
MKLKIEKSTVIKLVAVVVGLSLAFYLGTRSGNAPSGNSAGTSTQTETHAEEKETIWTCVMHLHIKRSEPGLCPVCGMELVPMDDSSDDSNLGDRQLVMTEWDKRLASIVTQPVERKFVDTQIRMVGKLEYDETKVKSISSWVNGRVDRLYVDYEGIQVKRGDHLVSLYSPDLVTGQEELIEAKRRVERGGKDKSAFLRESDLHSLESAREKLRLWGLSDAQVAAIESNEKAEDHILINSPQSGIVIHKAVNDGEYVKTGTHIYTVADLSSLWVKLDAYESDLQWLHYGQSVEIEAEAYPGEIFDGLIAFIDPVVNDKTRTVKVRVNVKNDAQLLKPGMFVRATVHAKLANSGKVMDAKLAGKWIGPMHPEIIRDEAGKCPICKMDLVRAETLGYVSAASDADAPLVIPASAVLRTGRRAVVYIEVPDRDRKVYEGREIVLGARAGDYYLVKSGLSEGEQVVVQGNFNIDSSLQIKAKPSMMSMPGDDAGTPTDPTLGPIRESLAAVYDSYFAVQVPMMEDDLDGTKTAFADLETAVAAVPMSLFDTASYMGTWMEVAKEIKSAAVSADSASTLDEMRVAFNSASVSILRSETIFGHSDDGDYYEAFCPMAFDDGASWLQSSRSIQNPYMGTGMPNCGEIRNTFSAAGIQKSSGAAATGHHH